ncbi:MAG: hypothetical protein KDJ29_07595 [Hyphomicrobiales bacterium]|nr:hypothetical protein [Hyphomicrobiales bacterium]
MSNTQKRIVIALAAFTMLAAPTMSAISTADAGEWSHRGHRNHHGFGGNAGAAAAGFVGGMILLNVLANAQRPHGYGSSPNEDGSRVTSAGIDGGHVVVVHDRDGRIVSRDFRPRRMTDRRRAAEDRRAARRAERRARAARRAANRAARLARRQARRARAADTYGSAYNPNTNRTTVAWNDAGGNRQVKHFRGRLSDRAVRRIVGR